MADTELDQLIKIGQSGGRNPVQESRYKQLLQEQGSVGSAAAGSMSSVLAGQDAKTKEFLGRYTTGIADARTAAETELGLPQLRQTTQAAGQTARDVSRQVQDIAPTQQTVAKQVGISAPRLQQRIGAETAKLQPAAEAARRSLEDATAAQSFGETQYTQRLQDYTQPYQVEAGMLSESLAREFSGYTNEMQNELTLTLEKLRNNQTVSSAEIARANELADAEANFQRQKELTKLNSQQAISTEQQMKNLGLGSYKSLGTTNGW